MQACWSNRASAGARFTLEVEGNEKPCFVGDSVTRVMAPAGSRTPFARLFDGEGALHAALSVAWD